MTTLTRQLADLELLEKVKKYLSETKITQSEFAKKIGCSAASINLYLNKKYEGNLENFENSLKKFLNFNNLAKSHKKIKLDFEETSVAKRVFNIAQMCQLNSEIAMCFGSSGLGKSTAIREYAKKNTGVIIVDPEEKICLKALLTKIGTALKIKILPNGFYSNQNFIEQIEERLKDSGHLIIIDEAENLNAELFRILRKIHDRCNFTFGLLFIGTNQLYNNVYGFKNKYEYVTNRISIIESLDLLTKNDANLLINQVFPEALDEHIEYFYEKSGANARILFSLLKRTYDIFINSQDELNNSMIKSASKWLFRG